ncbi:hypothetical protein D6D54_07550 [Spiroplasma poulsonii]|uniref:Uncharacterized protein n=1 Tax=Spiroplasma poulsonii TaxID=2138 RepID=A0A3S0URL0_9MOLU|nr:hypothetical protein [Spiroplasma poulsonii]MBW3059335.1 hypothetical protein [Spiroplasma poulsonii]RUP75885.1 hypothetical protein D6D54_07550 [Spiroplasma poulsonii]
MKKLLSILTISTLTASIPAPLLANMTLTRAKRDVGISTNSNNYKYLNFSKLSFINEKAQLVSIGKNSITYQNELTKKIYIVSKDNIKKEINIPTNDLVFITTLANDSVYFNANNGVYVLEKGESTAIKISGLSNSVKDITSYNNDVYFNANNGVYVLKQGSDT